MSNKRFKKLIRSEYEKVYQCDLKINDVININNYYINTSKFYKFRLVSYVSLFVLILITSLCAFYISSYYKLNKKYTDFIQPEEYVLSEVQREEINNLFDDWNFYFCYSINSNSKLYIFEAENYENDIIFKKYFYILLGKNDIDYYISTNNEEAKLLELNTLTLVYEDTEEEVNGININIYLNGEIVNEITLIG